MYTTDDVNWYDYNVGTDIMLYNQDDFVTFKAKNDSTGGLKSVDGSNYYKFSGTGTSGLKVEGNISYLYSADPDNNYPYNYQFSHLFDGFACNTQSGKESMITVPPYNRWNQCAYAFDSMFYGATISRIKILPDPGASGYSFDTNFNQWVASISNGQDTGPTFWIPTGMNQEFGDNAIPTGWNVEYSD